MKALTGTRLLVVMASGLVCGAAMLVFALTPTPTPKPNDERVQLRMRRVPYGVNNLLAALKATTFTDTTRTTTLFDHKDHFKLSYDDQDVGGGTYGMPTPTPTPGGLKAHNNVTQHVALQNSEELKTFVVTAFSTPAPTPSSTP